MRVIILGSAAGGGVPQWNCGCEQCRDARARDARRTQSSVAVSADGERWILLNASPDVGAQLAARRVLWPRGARGTPVRAVALTDAEIDHTLGLALLREGTAPLPVYAPSGVAALLDDEWPLVRLLRAYAGVEPRLLPDGQVVALADLAGTPLGISCTAVAVPHPPPRYAPAARSASFAVGLRLADERSGRALAYIPTAGRLGAARRPPPAGGGAPPV